MSNRVHIANNVSQRLRAQFGDKAPAHSLVQDVLRIMVAYELAKAERKQDADEQSHQQAMDAAFGSHGQG